MGQDKRFIAIGTTTLLDRCCAVMRRVFREVLVIIAQDSEPLEVQGCRTYRDLIPNCGSLGGLYTGLEKASCERAFVVACDMPFLQEDVIRLFVTREPDADIVMAQLSSGVQPMHAVYRKRILPVLVRKAQTGQLRIQDLVAEPGFRVTLVQPHEWEQLDPRSRSFHNVNTPADLAMIKASDAGSVSSA